MLEHTSSAWYLKKSVSFPSPSPALTPALITTSEELDHNILKVSIPRLTFIAKLGHFVTHALLRLFFFF